MSHQERTTRSYEKALRHGLTPDQKTIHLYCSRLDGKSVHFWITSARKRLWQGSSEAAAQAAFDQHLNGTFKSENIVSDKDLWVQTATDIETNPAHPWRQDLTIATLAALEHIAILRRGKSKQHANVSWTIVSALKEMPPIPKDADEIYAWAEVAVGKVCKFRVLQRDDDTDRKGSQNARRVRINMLIACLKHIERLPSLRAWSKGLPQVLSRLRSRRVELVAVGLPEENRPPFTKQEIFSMLDKCSRFEDLALVLAYLSLGTRSGDAEEADYTHIINDQYELVKIQSKTKTFKRPTVSLALKVLLRYKNEFPFNFGLVPDGVDKQQFRPTVGVLLTLSGVDALGVSTRLGHSTISMIVNHYVTIFPADYGGHKDVWNYLGVGPVSVSGYKTKETAWDNFILFQLLKYSEKFGIKNEIKEIIVRELTGVEQEMLQVADF